MATEQTTTPPLPEPPHAPPPGPPDKNDRGKSPKSGRGRLFRIALVLLVVFGILLLVGLLPRLHHNPQLKATARQQTNPTPLVSVVQAKTPPASDALSLPATIEAEEQTAITARATGYVTRRFTDIGDRVQAGQILALLSTPDLDAQVSQARAQVGASQAAVEQARASVSTQQSNEAQAEANYSRAEASLEQARTDLARARASFAQAQEAVAQQQAQQVQAQATLNLNRVTAQRYANLLADGATDQQTADQAAAAYQTSLANVQALQAAVRAAQANAQAFAEAVGSAQANVKAYADGVRAAAAAVRAAAANVRSFAAALSASAANVRSTQANLARTASLQGFGRVTAPFSGVITARGVDVGALVSAGSGGGGGSTVGGSTAGDTSLGNAAGGTGTDSASAGGSSGGSPTPLFSLAKLDTLRLYVSVPQVYAAQIQTGQNAQILVRERPGHPFLGKVTRTSQALDPATRTLVTEVHLNNPQGLLQPGMSATVRLRVPHPAGTLLLPDPALVTNAGGTQVILVGKNNRLHFQPVGIGRDFGQVIEVTSGLQKGQTVVANPSDALREGQTVKTQPAPPSPGGG